MVILDGWWVTALDIITGLAAVGRLSQTEKLSEESDLHYLGISWFGVPKKELQKWRYEETVIPLKYTLDSTTKAGWADLPLYPKKRTKICSWDFSDKRKIWRWCHTSTSTFKKMSLVLVPIYLNVKSDQWCLLLPEVLSLSRASWSHFCGAAWDEEERVTLVLFWNMSYKFSTPSCFLQFFS